MPVATSRCVHPRAAGGHHVLDELPYGLCRQLAPPGVTMLLKPVPLVCLKTQRRRLLVRLVEIWER